VTLSKDDIRRVPLGHYTRPAGDPLAGRRIVVGAYLVPLPDGLLLFDTGIGEGEPEFDRHYRIVRRRLRDGLRGLGVDPGDVGLVVNCHLHADHCGGNPELAGRPVFVQRAELEAARGPDYTIPALVDFPGAAYEVLDGEAEVLPGVRVIPTPGHTDGHQSVLLRLPETGAVIVCGDAVYCQENYDHDTWTSQADPVTARDSALKLRAVADTEQATMFYGHDREQAHSMRWAPTDSYR
jgi:N-acyl homoserine lactone hydrolase